jgi:type I restriction enzyme S subunit
LSEQKDLNEFGHDTSVENTFYAEEDVTLEDVCEFMMRGKHPDYVDQSEICVLNQKAIRWNEIQEENLKYHDPEVDMFENRFIREGDIVINSTGVGTPGRCYYFRETPDRMFADSHVTILRTDESRLNPEYLYYILSSSQYQKVIQNVASGSTGQIELNKRALQNIEISFPTIEEQNKIAETLSNFDKKIDANGSINELLEEISQTLYRSWFVDFDPYDDFKDSELGEIPVEFEIRHLTDIVEVTYGQSFDSDNFNEKGIGYPVIRNGDLPNDDVDYSTDKYIDHEFDSKYDVLPGDLVVSMDGEFRPYVWKGKKAALNQRVCKFDAVSNKYNNLFLQFLVEEPLYKLERAKTGTTVIHLGKRDIEDIKVPVPDDESLSRFVSLTSPMHEIMVGLAEENRHLTKLRDTLLPKLMSGEIRLDPDSNNEPTVND